MSQKICHDVGLFKRKSMAFKGTGILKTWNKYLKTIKRGAMICLLSIHHRPLKHSIGDLRLMSTPLIHNKY